MHMLTVASFINMNLYSESNSIVDSYLHKIVYIYSKSLSIFIVNKLLKDIFLFDHITKDFHVRNNVMYSENLA